jgi:tetratricopeptide (TPR) repeat protein
MDPNNPMVLISAYHAYHEIGEEETALDLVNRAVEVAPEDPTVLGQAGWAYLGFELPEQAVEVFEIVLSMEFENAWNTLGLAKALMMLNEQEDRIPELLHTAERSGTDQRDTGLLMMIGWTYREMGDCDNAVRLFTMVEEFEPGNEDAKEGINSCR